MRTEEDVLMKTDAEIGTARIRTRMKMKMTVKDAGISVTKGDEDEDEGRCINEEGCRNQDRED